MSHKTIARRTSDNKWAYASCRCGWNSGTVPTVKCTVVRLAHLVAR